MAPEHQRSGWVGSSCQFCVSSAPRFLYNNNTHQQMGSVSRIASVIAIKALLGLLLALFRFCKFYSALELSVNTPYSSFPRQQTIKPVLSKRLATFKQSENCTRHLLEPFPIFSSHFLQCPISIKCYCYQLLLLINVRLCFKKPYFLVQIEKLNMNEPVTLKIKMFFIKQLRESIQCITLTAQYPFHIWQVLHESSVPEIDFQNKNL